MTTDNSLVSNKPKPFVYLKNDPIKTQNNWKMWKAEFLIYLGLSEHQLHEDKKGLFLLNIMGADGIRALENISFDNPDDKHDLDILLGKFDDLFDPLRNESEVFARYEFFNCRKKGKEDFDNFVERLKEKARSCNFGAESDKLIRDMLILNLDKDTRECIFAHKESDLSEILKIIKIFCFQMEQMKEKKQCWRCKAFHKSDDCRATGVTCEVCKKKGHFTQNCPTRFKNKKNDQSKRQRHVPKSQNQEREILLCLWCETKHKKGIFSCPHNTTCLGCDRYPHKVCRQCRQSPCKDNCPAKTFLGEKGKESFEIDVPECIDCEWCGWCHPTGKCAHNFDCKTCSDFPHNICFQCKKNPHLDTCYFKDKITLPDQQNEKKPLLRYYNVSDKNNFLKMQENTNSQPSRKDPPPTYTEKPPVFCDNNINSGASSSGSSHPYSPPKPEVDVNRISPGVTSGTSYSDSASNKNPTKPPPYTRTESPDYKRTSGSNNRQSSNSNSNPWNDKQKTRKDKNDKEPCVIS